MPKRLLLTLTVLAASLGASSAWARGIDVSFISRDIRFVLFGELHGTVEIPHFFGDTVEALRKTRLVIVSLEMPQARDSDLQAYLSSDGSPAARRALLATATWTFPMRDGRTSEAMLGLIERLRVMKATDPTLRVVSCMPSAGGLDNSAYERAMGECWIDAQAAQREATLVALVGNAHSSRTGPAYPPAAAALSEATSLALTVRTVGGDSWGCTTAQDCGPHPIPRPTLPADTRLGITLEPFASGPVRYDGRFIAGRSFTASPPATADASAS